MQPLDAIATPPPRLNFLTVEGVIGVGKTSFCEILTKSWNCRFVREQIDDNPFLPRFYEDRRSFAFQTQLWFLLSRYRQLAETVPQQDLFHRITVCDYLFARDRIFAHVNLNEDELRLYDRVAGILEAQVPKSDLVVYLQASTEVLLRRIAKRGRSFEFNMDRSYIDLLNEAFNHFFFHYEGSPLIVINTDSLDFVNDKDDLREILEQIVKARAGITYYQPVRARDRPILKGRRPPEG